MTTPALTEVQIREIIQSEMRRSSQCSASHPHIGKLSYVGRGEYICECGKSYHKSRNQPGSLEES